MILDYFDMTMFLKSLFEGKKERREKKRPAQPKL